MSECSNWGWGTPRYCPEVCAFLDRVVCSVARPRAANAFKVFKGSHCCACDAFLLAIVKYPLHMDENDVRWCNPELWPQEGPNGRI